MLLPRPLPPAFDEHLSNLSTHYSQLRRVHDPDSPEAARGAVEQIFLRYHRAILRYVQAAVPDANDANDILQRFFVKLMEGKFRSVSPERGRFRSFVKATLFHMVSDLRREKGRDPRPLPDDPSAIGFSDGPHDEAQFTACWLETLMDRAWESLAAIEEGTGRPFATVFHHTIPPQRRSAQEIADQLATRPNGRPANVEWVRSVRSEARQAFQDFVLAEVWDSFEAPTPEIVEEELIALDLREDFKSAVLRRAEGTHRRRPSPRQSIRSGNRAPSPPRLLGSAASVPRS